MKRLPLDVDLIPHITSCIVIEFEPHKDPPIVQQRLNPSVLFRKQSSFLIISVERIKFA